MVLPPQSTTPQCRPLSPSCLLRSLTPSSRSSTGSSAKGTRPSSRCTPPTTPPLSQPSLVRLRLPTPSTRPNLFYPITSYYQHLRRRRTSSPSRLQRALTQPDSQYYNSVVGLLSKIWLPLILVFFRLYVVPYFRPEAAAPVAVAPRRTLSLLPSRLSPPLRLFLPSYRPARGA